MPKYVIITDVRGATTGIIMDSPTSGNCNWKNCRLLKNFGETTLIPQNKSPINKPQAIAKYKRHSKTIKNPAIIGFANDKIKNAIKPRSAIKIKWLKGYLLYSLKNSVNPHPNTLI